MADELNEVRPGDRITADLMNTLIRRVKNPGGGAGTISVPNVFGINLGGARNTITGAGLTVGAVIDTAGANVDPNVTDNHTRLIINQVPEPGAFLSSGQTVSLTVTAQAAGTTGAQVPDVFGLAFSDAKQQLQTAGQFSVSDAYDPFGTTLTLTDSAIQSRRVLAQVPPAGTRLTAGSPVKLVLSAEAPADVGTVMRITSINPSPAPIRSEIQILGANFAPTGADNIVRFNGVLAAPPSSQSTSTSLFVVIPDLTLTQTSPLPGLTLSTTGETNIGVTIETPTAHAGGQMKALPPLSKHLPVIEVIRLADRTAPPDNIFALGQSIHVGLAGVQNSDWWTAQIQEKRLYFDGLPFGGARPTAPGVNPISDIYTIPAELPGINQGETRTVNVRVWFDGYLSPAFAIKVKRP